MFVGVLGIVCIVYLVTQTYNVRVCWCALVVNAYI